MFIQIKTHGENTREQSVVHINAAQIGTIHFGEGDAEVNFTVGPDAFTTKDSDSIKALRSLIGLSHTSAQTAIDIWSRIRTYEAQDAALSVMR